MFVATLIGLSTCLVLLLSCAGRIEAYTCVCTPSNEATPVYVKSDSLSEMVGNISANTCLHGDLVEGKEWLLLSGSSDYFIQIKKLTACPNGRVEIKPNIMWMPKKTEANHHIEHKRFLLDSLNQAQCDFEVSSLCSWRNIHGHDDFDWVLYRASTPTDDTGPDFDHTTRNASGSYIFTESSAPRNLFDTAWIESPTIEVTPDPVHCFRFWYHMHGSSIGRLNVYQVTNGGLPGNLVWSLTGDQGNSWKEGQVPLNSSQSYSILLSGVVGNGYQGDIAVDDVNVRVGYCDVKPPSASRTDVTNITSTTVNGQWSDWNSWGSCSVTCNVGQHVRNRTCVAPKGTRCQGVDHESELCSISLCPSDGHWFSWTQWSLCSATCGHGLIKRERQCVFPVTLTPMGKYCEGPANEIQACHNTTDCTVNGHWSAWGSWESCSVTCDIGQHVRNRTCEHNPAAPQGAMCHGADKETEICFPGHCRRDGLWTSWSHWTICSTTCGNGLLTRERRCVFPVPLAPKGKDCEGAVNETQACTNTTDCPVDGNWNEWSSWSTCSVTCGDGDRSRNRTCLFEQGKPHGHDCVGQGLQNGGSCMQGLCPVNGHWSAWGSWTACSRSCDIGQHTRNRTCVYDPVAPHGTRCPGNDHEATFCLVSYCPRDGVWTSWSPWSRCSTTCGDGLEIRGRKCINPMPAAPLGKDCEGPVNETQACANTTDCAANITMASRTTEANHQTEHKRFLLDSLNQAKCDFEVNSLCSWRNVHGHDDFDWVLYRASTPTDDTGPDFDHTTRNSSGSYIFTESSAPRNSFDTAWIESPTIEVTPDPVHCFRFWYHMYGSSKGRLDVYQVTTGGLPGNLIWSLTGDHGNSWKDGQVPLNSSQSYSILLSGVVGNGYQGDIAVDDVAVSVGYCDVKPPSASRTDVTNTTSDTVDGHWNAWALWSTCSVTCGHGDRSRNRTCLFEQGKPRGHACSGQDSQTGSCTESDCPVDGVWKTWAAWSICDVTCGGGTQQRTRDCYFPSSAPHGLNCTGESAEKTTCNEELCPVDGVLEEWSSWTTCSQTCGVGNQTRSRDCTFPGAGPHGKPCNGHTIDSQPCNPQVCTVNGHWSAWGSWGSCSATCDIGQHVRNRTCEYDQVAQPWARCPGHDHEATFCSVSYCPRDGVWTDWSQWSRCSTTCGGGLEIRGRKCVHPFPLAPLGKDCEGPVNETKACHNTTDCAVDGHWGEWASWSTCSVTCGHGDRFRNRTCLFEQGKPRGHDCVGQGSQTDSCTEKDCPVDGVWKTWAAWSICDVTCGGGTQQRTRDCYFPSSAPHGLNCTGASAEKTAFNVELCPVDGVLGEWSSWTTCSHTCGGGNQTRIRDCTFPGAGPHGKPCNGQLSDSRACNSEVCTGA